MAIRSSSSANGSGITRSEFFEVVGATDADGGSRCRTPAEVVTEALRVLERRDPPSRAG